MSGPYPPATSLAAGSADNSEWNRYECAGTPLDVAVTLSSGQAFRWRQDNTGVWRGIIGDIGAALCQPGGDPDGPLYWQTWPQANRWDILSDYFRLDVPLDNLYAEWTQSEPAMHSAIERFRGLRLLRQSPRECLFSFLCATCNTVVKIERSVAKLAERYGGEIPSFSAVSDTDKSTTKQAGGPCFYSFPTLEALSITDEKVLRSDLWGYRAPRVPAAAQAILERGGEAWLLGLRTTPYEEAHAALCELEGIGAKVADCICLFCLDKDQACPIDTHIRQIAARLFPGIAPGKSLTARVYAALADAYRERFGPYAGWAQQYLFFAELHRARSFV